MLVCARVCACLCVHVPVCELEGWVGSADSAGLVGRCEDEACTVRKMEVVRDLVEYDTTSF